MVWLRTTTLPVTVLWVTVLLLTPIKSFDAAAASQADPAIRFMQRVARDLMSAAKVSDHTKFATAIKKYGFEERIGLFALGQYKPYLKKSDRSLYYAGMVGYLSRYAAFESRKYRVKSAQFFAPTRRTNDGVEVDSRVNLEDGSSYDVTWLLIPRGRSFQVMDAKVSVLVMSGWLTPYLQNQFVEYMNAIKGTSHQKVRALIHRLKVISQ